MADQRRLAADRGERRRLDREVEGRREPHRADHPQGVLVEAAIGLADGPQDAGLDVGRAAERVDKVGLGDAAGRRRPPGRAPGRPMRSRSP